MLRNVRDIAMREQSLNSETTVRLHFQISPSIEVEVTSTDTAKAVVPKLSKQGITNEKSE